MVRMRTIRLFASSLTIALLLVSASPALAKEQSHVSVGLQNTGVDPDAAGRLRSRLQEDGAVLSLKLKRLDAGRAYTMQVNGIDRVSFTADPRGRATLIFEEPRRRAVARLP